MQTGQPVQPGRFGGKVVVDESKTARTESSSLCDSAVSREPRRDRSRTAPWIDRTGRDDSCAAATHTAIGRPPHKLTNRRA
ncbi:hypothetical protein GCM10011609_77460 [Lentzea pudingi]|uniref:Uncharacterized protein n=1 Tax=Lentzea pudingi TaxID=1789439 RepID=A0ABQ2IRQ6_9PSEU|nr:hypothetical protein GCM10011609_77460 [Lentzea pudingi]